MVDGQVGFHRPENVRKIDVVEKNNAIVNALNKTKEEKYPDLKKEQEKRLEEIRNERIALRKKEEKEKRILEEDRRREKEERSYDRIHRSDNMTSNAGTKRLMHWYLAYLYRQRKIMKHTHITLLLIF